MTDRRSLWLPILLAAGAAPGMLPAAPRLMSLPEQVGPYRLREELGAGGMGVVHRAEQEGPVVREVAVKLVRPEVVAWPEDSGLPAPELVRRRFLLERQLLASIEHEHVVRLYDAGETEAGEPWLAMELVRGAPITEFCDAGRFDVDARLELFADLCRVVEHLHRRGIEHRDLKPANVLVVDRDGRAVPKLVDFGLATLSGHQLVGDEHMTGTPTHMAPEQFRLPAVAVDRRADVHALGVILYELLTGALPVVPPGPGGEVVLGGRAATPSARLAADDVDLTAVADRRRTDGRTLVRRLRGGLDRVVLAAIAPDRSERTPTAGELADAATRLASGGGSGFWRGLRRILARG